MNKEWITISEAVGLTKKSEPTIRRFVSEHKNKHKAIRKENGKYYINNVFLNQFYTTNQNTNHTTSHNDESRYKKEAMQIAYNSEIIKAKDEHIKEKDKQIEILINKKSCAWIWLTLGFTILIIALGCIGYWLFKEYKSELSSNHQKEVNLKEKNITELKTELNETKTAYTQTLKNIDVLHTKYNDKLDNKDKILQEKEQQYKADLKAERENINKLQEQLRELSHSQPLITAESDTNISLKQ